MPKHTFKKFQRAKNPPKFKINETDLQILQQLADYRFLNSKHLIALNPEISERSVKRRLQHLYHSGFVERPAQQLAYFEPSSHLVYALGKKGARLVFPNTKIQQTWTKKNKRIKPFFLLHFLMISSFRVILNLALKDKKESKLIKWQEEDLRDNVQIEDRYVPIAPDSFLTIEDKGDYLHFFLEADRSTMTLKRILTKMSAYWTWWKEDGHTRKLDITRFRVLVITLSEQRKDNLREITKNADDSQQGSGMFWFTSEKSYNLNNPESILKPIWQTPKDNTLHHILE